MYHAAAQLSPDDVFDVARMAFLEMVLAGTTTVGEFHYLHNDVSGRPYDDPNLLAKQVIAAARSVGIRIVLLRTAYLRSGYQLPPDPGQARFFESAGDFVRNMQALTDEYSDGAPDVRFGVALHSICAVPLHDLEGIAAWANRMHLPLHIHVAEQVAENAACTREYGYTPVQLLGRNNILNDRFTAVHSIHIRPDEIEQLASAREVRFVPARQQSGTSVMAFSQPNKLCRPLSALLWDQTASSNRSSEDARELDYHLRLRDQQRAILDSIEGRADAERLLSCATKMGHISSVPAGEFIEGALADGFTVDLDDLSIAGHSSEDLLPILCFR